MEKYPNMIVLRTLSKIGFAGLRIGVLAASPAIVAELNKIRLPYNINTLSQVGRCCRAEAPGHHRPPDFPVDFRAGKPI